jgi:hypothetical protein
MADQLDPIDEAYARLSVHEFILEVITAELLAAASEDISTAFKERLREVGSQAYGPLTADPAKMQAIDARRVAILERLITQISERERDMRAGRSQNS